jgi:hypothetical protein
MCWEKRRGLNQMTQYKCIAGGSAGNDDGNSRTELGQGTVRD